MVDKISPARRSFNMSRVRSENTGPELIVRQTAHRLGYRFRLHRKDLPGSPDLVFPARKTALFVHGCFWHRHNGCIRTTTPATRTDFWNAKFRENEARDARVRAALAALGWKVRVIWECQTENVQLLERRLSRILSGSS